MHLYSGGIGVVSSRVEVWLRGPRAGQPGISPKAKSALAAAGGGLWGWLQQRPNPHHYRSAVAAHTRLRPRRSVSHLPQASPRRRLALRAIWEPGSRRLLRLWVMTGSHTAELREDTDRAAETHRRSTGATPTGRSHPPLNAVGGFKLDSLVRHVARFVNSEVAGVCGPGAIGAAARLGLLDGAWGRPHEQIARPLEGGFVGHALYSPAQRVALEPPGLVSLWSPGSSTTAGAFADCELRSAR